MQAPYSEYSTVFLAEQNKGKSLPSELYFILVWCSYIKIFTPVWLFCGQILLFKTNNFFTNIWSLTYLLFVVALSISLSLQVVVNSDGFCFGKIKMKEIKQLFNFSFISFFLFSVAPGNQ